MTSDALGRQLAHNPKVAGSNPVAVCSAVVAENVNDEIR